MINFQDHFLKLHLYNPLIGHKTFQFSSKDSVSDLRNTVCETTQLMLYENFHFEHENKVLSQFLQMGQTLTSGAKINIVFNSFDQRSSKFHYYKIKNLLENPTILVNHHFSYDDQSKKEMSQIKPHISENIDTFTQALQKEEFMDYRSIQLDFNFHEWLNFSGFNPVPYYRRLMGDFYYVYFKSPEDIDYHITGHSEGFFLNQSTSSHFNPSISPKNSKIYISLLDLLYSVSPKFKQMFKSCLNKLKDQEVQKSLIGPLANKKPQWIRQKIQINQPNTWKINPMERSQRKDEILTIKDWNEMFQIQHMEPSSNLYEKINRQKLKFKIYQQFVDHSKVGAISIIDKQVCPMNPNCPKNEQTFLFTNIYFSLVDNSYQEKDFIEMLKSNGNNFVNFGKKESKNVNNYILNLQTVDNTQGLDLHLSHSVLIQYKGQKLRAQSLPSSLIYTKQKNQPIQSIVQSKNSINSHVLSTKQCPNSFAQKDFTDSLLKLTFKLNLEHDTVVKILNDDLKVAKKVSISTQLRGVQTVDKRKYLFNLHSLSPKDYNFLPNYSGKQNNHLAKQSNPKQLIASKQNCFQDYDHLVYRPQLIALYNQKFKCRIPINCMLGKYLNGGYQIIMNQKLRNQQKKLKSLASFAKDHVINMVISVLEGDMKKYLADSKNIIQIMHKYGLNVRYLGLLYKKIDKKKSPHLSIIIEKVIYVKSVKNIINTALKSVSQSNLKHLVAHFLNCIFFHSKVNSEEYTSWRIQKQQQSDHQQNYQNIKKKKKKYKQKEKQDSLLTLFNQENGDFFLSLKPSQLNILINKIAKIKYNHEFQCENQTIEPKIFKYRYGKTSLLRDICLNSGIIIEKRDYFSEISSNPSLPFLPEHICGFMPRCTHTNPDKKQLDHLIAQGDNYLSQFFVEEAIDSYNKAIQYILTTFGGNNEKLPLIHKKLSFIYFKIGDIDTALLFGSHSLGMFQQFYGVQHVQTIDNFAMLGIYYCAQRNFTDSQQCLFKAIYYAYMAFGEVYPQILTHWLNLSTIYEIQKNFTSAIMCLYEGLRICIKIFTQNHLNTAIFYAALSALHFQIPDIMSAIKFKEKCVSILQKILPQNDLRIKQSLEMLQYLKSLQSSKKIKQVHEKELRKLQNSTFGYHPPQVGGWQYNGRNGRGSLSGNMMGFGNKNLGKMQEYILREGEQHWRRTIYGGRRVR